MEAQEYLEKMKIIHDGLLTYIENEENTEENFQNFIKLVNDFKIQENWHEIKTLLFVFSKILDNHRRSPSFFTKFSQIFHFFKNDIQRNFSNLEIFDLFKNNKRAILLLSEEQIITIDQTITNIMLNSKYNLAKYPLYFFPEMKPFLPEELIQEYSKQIPENFEEKRKLGENDNPICEVIRKGLMDDFTSFVTENQISLSSKVEPSLFETNSYLLKNQPSLIEYAAFFGETPIVNYLHTNYIDLEPSIWLFAVHGQNLNLIHLLQDNNISQINDSYELTLKESLKCHHNEITNYILSTLPPTETEISLKIFWQSFEFYNFTYMEDTNVNASTFYHLCVYGYYPLVEDLLKDPSVDVNMVVIFNFFYFSYLVFKINCFFQMKFQIKNNFNGVF